MDGNKSALIFLSGNSLTLRYPSHDYRIAAPDKAYHTDTMNKNKSRQGKMDSLFHKMDKIPVLSPGIYLTTRQKMRKALLSLPYCNKAAGFKSGEPSCFFQDEKIAYKSMWDQRCSVDEIYLDTGKLPCNSTQPGAILTWRTGIKYYLLSYPYKSLLLSSEHPDRLSLPSTLNKKNQRDKIYVDHDRAGSATFPLFSHHHLLSIDGYNARAACLSRGLST